MFDPTLCDACLTRPVLGLLTLTDPDPDGAEVAAWWTCGPCADQDALIQDARGMGVSVTIPSLTDPSSRRRRDRRRGDPRAAGFACRGLRAPTPPTVHHQRLQPGPVMPPELARIEATLPQAHHAISVTETASYHSRRRVAANGFGAMRRDAQPGCYVLPAPTSLVRSWLT